ncbi:AMP-dependent ligase [Luteimonas padinae]|uniref:Class I adenylate-forming enzyme family protein n=1 Tax=Luteimonas padinae TaxID=1714359 RepID=A0ABV6T117_9GAMM|nr:class I adenylate-forming enzyme family protein [Luteimonas padinae]GHD65387.1 AMP-dependent ligase [Luteimonas padinae]
MSELAVRLLQTARRRPSAPAIADGGCRADYATLASAAQRFAALLRARGLRSGDRVAVVLPNRYEAVVACYGCWLAGIVLVPLNAQASRRELASWLAHCEPSLVLVEEGDAEAAAAVAQAGLEHGRLALGASRDPAWPPGPAGQAAATCGEAGAGDGLAMILYTSGTTGAPKGVALGHDNLHANVQAVVEDLGLGEDDCTVSVLAFCYAYGVSVLHTHLFAGGCVVLEPNMVFPHLVVDALEREGATGFSGVPSTFALFLERGVFEGRLLPRLRYLTQAGGAMTVALARRLRAQLPGVRLHIMYGQTEASARLASVPPARLDDKPGSAGRPLSGVRLEIRDEAGRALAPGVEGEVWARSPGVMRGYWRDPAATALVLRDGWLRTGDLGRLDDEGYLFLAGRRNDMIKTGAHRVHPLDVEEALLEHPAIAEAAVAGIDDATLGQVVKAWVVARDPGLDARAVRAHCRGRLAAWKIPRDIEFLPALPRTTSGKVRRAALAGTTSLETTP